MFDLHAAIRAWRNGLASRRSLSTNQLDELEDHLRSEYQSLVDAGLAPTHAWARAREGLGAPAELSAEYRKIDGVAWRRLIEVGWVMFAASFFLPVHRYGVTVFDVDLFAGVLPGFQAFFVALTGEAGAVGIVSALTNIVMAITMWRIADPGRDRIVALAGIMTASALLNGWWMYAAEGTADLRIGYYVWWASFGLVSTGLVLRARVVASRARPVPST